MKRVASEELPHRVTYRFVGGRPEDGILSCGFMHKTSAQKSQSDFVIPYYSCFVLLDGGGEYWDETGFSAELGPGSVVQRLPGRVHTTRVNGDGRWVEFYVSFGRCVYDSLTALGLLEGDRPVGYFAQPERQLPMFRMLLDQMSAAPDHMLLPSLLGAQQIACEITGGTDRRSRRSPEISRACELLEKDLERELSLRAVAGNVHMGYETFRKEFLREVGVSPDEYRQTRRMTTAQMMLMEGESVKAVARTLGYSDAYAFSKQFKRFSGMAPGACSGHRKATDRDD